MKSQIVVLRFAGMFFMSFRFLAAAMLMLGFSRLLAESPEPQSKEPSLHQKIYFFEHRLLPNWVHSPDGAFFADLEKGSTDLMSKAATDIIGKEFADAIHVKGIEKDRIVLLQFPKPKEAPECFYAAVIKSGSAYRYITLEMGDDLMKQGVKTFLCEWKSDGQHADYGPRQYDDEEHFVSEVTKLIQEDAGQISTEKPKPAESTQPAK